MQGLETRNPDFEPLDESRVMVDRNILTYAFLDGHTSPK